MNRMSIMVIVGPTASGKSALAVALAKRVNGEIISADSRQVYRGMDIGTGKITKREMRGVPHFLLDVASPRTGIFTAARFQRLGRAAIKNIIARGKLPIIAGGTGFYIDALIANETIAQVAPDPALRKKLEAQSPAALYKKLQKVDQQRAVTIDAHNKRRLVRAIEVAFAKNGKPSMSKPNYNVIKLGMLVPKGILRKKIRARMLGWFKQGLLKEVQSLHDDAGMSWKQLDGVGLVYRYASRYLRGQITKEAMLQKLETELWHYAKRQITWFKRDPEIHWIKNEREAVREIKNWRRE